MSDDTQAFLARVKADRYTFRNEPVLSREEDLKRLSEDLQREATRWPEVQTVAGDMTRCKGGVIDLRLIACYDIDLVDDASHNFGDVVRIIGTRNILDDSCLCLDEETYLSLGKVDPLLNPEFIFGRRLEVRRVKEDEVRFYAISRMLDLLSTGFVELLYRMELHRDVDTKRALVFLDRFRRVIQLTRIIMRRQTKAPSDELGERIAALVANWFELGLPRYHQLIKVIRESFVTVHQLIGEMDRYFQTARIANIQVDRNAERPQGFLATERHSAAFVSDWNPLEAIEVGEASLHADEPFMAVLPASFAVQLCEYARGTEMFHRYVKSCFKAEGVSGNFERSYICWERSKLLNRCQEIAARLNGGRPGSDLVLGCNLKPGMTVAKAANAMTVQRNKAHLKRMARLIRSEGGPRPDTAVGQDERDALDRVMAQR